LAQSRNAATLNRLLELAGLKTAPAWQRIALLAGVKASGIRTIDAMPAAIDRAAESSDPDVARLARELHDQLVWPEKFGAAPVPFTAAEQALFEKGKVAYATICANCHQPDGRGREGVAAPLVDSPWVLGPEEFLARIVLKGKTGKTTVTMPPLEMLGNETLAGALTYIRRSWGHNAAPVSPTSVEHVREAIILRSQPFTEAELTALRDGR
jgi:mono/diheme cytochrome c family protein